MLIRNLEPKQKLNCVYYRGILFENLVDDCNYDMDSKRNGEIRKQMGLWQMYQLEWMII